MAHNLMQSVALLINNMSLAIKSCGASLCLLAGNSKASCAVTRRLCDAGSASLTPRLAENSPRSDASWRARRRRTGRGRNSSLSTLDPLRRRPVRLGLGQMQCSGDSCLSEHGLSQQCGWLSSTSVGGGPCLLDERPCSSGHPYFSWPRMGSPHPTQVPCHR